MEKRDADVMQAVLLNEPISQNHKNTLVLRTEMSLPKGKVVRIEAEDADGVIVRCYSGILWVTQKGFPEDVLLQKGKEFRSFSEGLIVIEALETAEFLLL